MSDYHLTPDGILHTPANREPMTEFWVFVTVDEAGNEGLCAVGMDHSVFGRVMAPLVTSVEAHLPQMRERAEEFARLTRQRVRLLKFSAREEVEINAA